MNQVELVKGKPKWVTLSSGHKVWTGRQPSLDGRDFVFEDRPNLGFVVQRKFIGRFLVGILKKDRAKSVRSQFQETLSERQNIPPLRRQRQVDQVG